MKHKVTCMDCGKKETLTFDPEGKNKQEWIYWGKINVASCKTDKYFWKQKNPKMGFERSNLVKVANPCFDASVKPKWVEMWECLECYQKELGANKDE